MSFVIVIPARSESTRLPGKPLRVINGKPLLQWTYERALKTRAEAVYILAGDEEINQAVCKFAPFDKVTLEDDPAKNGTERIGNWFVKELHALRWDRVVNLQCDEPLIGVGDLNKLGLESGRKEVVTLSGYDDARSGDRNQTRVVANWRTGQCYWFARYYMGNGTYNHVGVYSFSRKFFESGLWYKETSMAERNGLEQLSWLENGGKVFTKFTDRTPPSVNCEADLLTIGGQLDA